MVATQADKDAHKIMRRGTRACREYYQGRRRKIRCIYDDEKSDICQECTLHRRQCVKQGLVRTDDKASNVKVQVTRLESAIEKLAREQGDKPFQHATEEDAADLAFVEEQMKKRSPIYTIFDNEFLANNATLPANGTDFPNQILFPRQDLSDREKLLSTVQNIPDLSPALNYANEWWISWREQHFTLRKTASSLSLTDFVQQKLSDSKVVEIAKGLLAVAMALAQIPGHIGNYALNLPFAAKSLMEYILAAVDQIVCDSETYKMDNEIILLYMMRAKHHIENNQLRKAWLRIRQGIRCAQALGFGGNKPAMSDGEAERQRFIAAVFEIDHMLSMLLGFPYAKDPAFTDARAFSVLLNPAPQDEELKMRALRRIVAITAGRVNDRNASGDINDEFTVNTQATLNMIADCMPTGWWDLLSQPLSGVAQHRFESIMAQTWFWVVQSYLHLPYVIKPTQKDAHHRQLGLEGARNLIRGFNYLRTEPAVSMYLCNCDDFQALLGACILLVGVLQNLSEDSNGLRSKEVCTRKLYADMEADLALVEDLKDIFRYRINIQAGGISEQGLAVLEEITSLLYEDEDRETSFKGDVMAFNIDLSKRQKTIMLPYFGTIKIELTKKLLRGRPQDHTQHMMLTPPTSVDGCDSCSSEGMFDATAFENQESEFYDMGSMASGLGGVDMPAICWEQWEGYMFNQELNQDWNPSLQWNADVNELPNTQF